MHRTAVVTRDNRGRYRRLAVIDGRGLVPQLAAEFAAQKRQGTLTPRNVVAVYRALAEHRLVTRLVAAEDDGTEPYSEGPQVPVGVALRAQGSHVEAPDAKAALSGIEWQSSTRLNWHLDEGMTGVLADATNPLVLIAFRKQHGVIAERRGLSPLLLAEAHRSGDWSQLGMDVSGCPAGNDPSPTTIALARYARSRRGRFST